MHTHKLTYMHAYTYTHAYIYTYRHTPVCTQIEQDTIRVTVHSAFRTRDASMRRFTIDAYINTYIHKHTYIHTYIHTNIQTYIHTHTYACTYRHTPFCTQIEKNTGRVTLLSAFRTQDASMRRYKNTYMNTYIRVYIQTYSILHTHWTKHRSSDGVLGVSNLRCLNATLQKYIHKYIHTCIHTDTEMASRHMYKCTSHLARTSQRTTLQQITTHCNTLQHTRHAHDSLMSHIQMYCNILQYTATRTRWPHVPLCPKYECTSHPAHTSQRSTL